MSIEGELAQQAFLQQGGVFARALLAKRKSGEMALNYEYQEYPKMLRISEGFHEVECSTEIGNGSAKRYWKENKEFFREVIVGSEEEEEAVLYGGKTAAQKEDERVGLLNRARVLGLKVDASWSAVRLRRELGDKMGGGETAEQLHALQAELDGLRKVAEMQAEIDALRAQLSGRGSADDLRAQLEALGVAVDKRWGVARLREELETATAPEARAA